MILVTGCARSGTSLITRMLQAHGCYLGRANRVNVLFENVTIRENILKAILNRVGADPLGQDPLPDTDNLPAWLGLRDSIFAAFADGKQPFAYKDAKISLLWPLFHHAFPDAKWVLVRREKSKIVESCMRAPFMRRRATPEAWGEWVDQHQLRFAAMRRELDMVEVWTDEVIADGEAFCPVAEHCGLAFKQEAVEHSIDRKRWHAAPSRLPQVHRSSA